MNRITHIITGLDVGGAEMMLFKLLSRSNRTLFAHEVISLMDIGIVGKQIEALGIPVYGLGMQRGKFSASLLIQLINWLRRNPPHLVQTWMYHSDLLGGLSTWLAGRIPLFWNLRQSNLDQHHVKFTTIGIAKLCALLSYWLPQRIICCSMSTQRIHAELGYDKSKLIVIPNGFDLTTFAPNPPARIQIRHELKLPNHAILIGLVGRFDPQKDHQTFFDAVAAFQQLRLTTIDPDSIHFILCGDGITSDNPTLMSWLNKSGVRTHYHLLGPRNDIPYLTAAFDLATSSSAYGEGFPNVIGEAMACAVPCVVTDVGDSALIVGNTGRVVPPRTPLALAQAWAELLELAPMDRTLIGVAACQRIETHFNLVNVVSLYEELWQTFIGSS